VRGALASALLVAGFAPGCAPPPIDVAQLAIRHPVLDAIDGHRLGDVTPYLLPVHGTLTYFLCRWPVAEAIRVSAPPDATFAERSEIELALRAWEDAGLGVRFAPESSQADIEIRFTTDPTPSGGPPRAANALADCAIGSSALETPPGDPIDARVVFASIHLSRTGRDAFGRQRPWSPEERVGALLHELGHALGFQGHAQRGETVMVSSVDDVRRAGQRLLAGQRFRDPTLEALYAVPTGAVVGRVPLAESRTRPVDRMTLVARSRGFGGPFAQVGDHVARLFWRDSRGTRYRLLLSSPKAAMRRPRELSVFPGPRAADLLRAQEGGPS
jgi:hypothetical protein